MGVPDFKYLSSIFYLRSPRDGCPEDPLHGFEDRIGHKLAHALNVVRAAVFPMADGGFVMTKQAWHICVEAETGGIRREAKGWIHGSEEPDDRGADGSGDMDRPGID